ncbi:MAG TPA: hypothetical protein VH109_02750 [Steroidobacteraceae bacterium]|nr:hypothetical protein [Steroidobacteraceae bacterium]
MSTLTVQATAAASAIVISTIAAWAFVSSSASIDRDPFHFAEVMAANARAHEGPMLTRNFERDCSSESLGTDRPISGRKPVCRRGG